MAIIQISKIQQRSGNLVDLPQLDEAEFGFASDDKRLFIGKESPNENIEVLTSYSEISLSQLEGAVGNLNIDPLTVENGQVLAFDGTNWVNKGGNAGGLITLGNISNVRIDGGGIGYVLETDGTGNLNWTPKSTITSYILNVTNANPAVVTTTSDNFFMEAAEVTITNVTGMTELNGNTYYVDVLTSNSFALYSDSALSTPINSTAYGDFPYTTGTGTSSSGNIITVGDSSAFSINDPVAFLGTLGNSGIIANTTYYIKTLPSSTQITISETVGGPAYALITDTISATVYAPGGRIISATGGSSGPSGAGGTTYSVQYNDSGIIQGSADLTWNFAASPRVLTINGNANVGNLNGTGIITGSRLISNVTTGTAPITVTSTTRVSNLSVDYANVSDYSVVTNINTSANFYPVFVSTSSTGNKELNTSANFILNPATGNANVGNLGTTGSITATGNITGGNIRGIIAAGSNTITTTGNANVGNLGFGTGVITGTGNITGGNLIGTIAAGSNTITTTGNITGGNIIGIIAAGSNTITTTGNITGGNIIGIIAAGSNTITTTGNITGGNIIGIIAAGSNTITTTGNANVGNLGTTGRIISTLTTGTAPFTVTSTTRVANLNVSYSNVSDFGVVTSQSTGIYYPVFVNGSSTGNYALASNSGISANLANGSVTATTFVGNIIGNISGTLVAPGSNTQVIFNDSGNANATSGLTFNKTTNQLSVTGNANVGNIGASTGVFTNISGTLTTASQTNITSVGTLGSLLVTANVTAGNLIANTVLQSTNITTGANTTVGSITGNWSLTTGSRLTATYADLAEYYSADKFYYPGTVLEFGGEHEVTLATSETSKVAGVVSSEPAYVMNGSCPGDYPTAIALQGRVMCKVRGPVAKGDMLISAGDGYAKAATEPKIGTIIGKSLENLSSGHGMIEVAVGRL